MTVGSCAQTRAQCCWARRAAWPCSTRLCTQSCRFHGLWCLSNQRHLSAGKMRLHFLQRWCSGARNKSTCTSAVLVCNCKRGDEQSTQRLRIYRLLTVLTCRLHSQQPVRWSRRSGPLQSLRRQTPPVSRLRRPALPRSPPPLLLQTTHRHQRPPHRSPLPCPQPPMLHRRLWPPAQRRLRPLRQRRCPHHRRLRTRLQSSVRMRRLQRRVPRRLPKLRPPGPRPRLLPRQRPRPRWGFQS